MGLGAIGGDAGTDMLAGSGVMAAAERKRHSKRVGASMNIEAQIAEVGQSAEEQRVWFTSALRIALPFSERRVLLVAVDTLLVNGAVLAALYLWAWIGPHTFGPDFVRARWFWFPVLTVLWWFLAPLSDLYDVSIAGNRLEITQRIGLVGVSLLLVYLAAYFLLPRNVLPRVFFLLFVGIALPSIVLWRWICATVFTLPPFLHRVLIAGAGWAGRTMAQALASYGNADYHVVGFVDDDVEKQGATVAGLPVLGTSRDLLTLVQARRVDDVVMAITHHMQGELFQALMDCRAAGVHVTRMPVLYEQLTRRVPVEHVEQGWVVESMNDLPTLHRPAQWVKRLLDVALGLLGSLVFLVLLPFLALAITLDCPGPIFYRQVRLGLGGRPYRMLKLRTMVPDAEEDGHARWATTHDERITRVGRFLRKTRLDELPQMFNVLRGEMSIVGPRPERPEFIAELQESVPFYRTRLVVKPGLTGWAQIHYGYGNSVRDALIKLQYDLYYIRHWSLWMELYVIFRTIGVIFRFRGV
jgi:exopolysaccharide biosynthesis polyprenyl glycosylphosphotransferase